jgi:hypothetical protein
MNNVFHDYANKSYLTSRNARSAEESKVEKVGAVIGLVFMTIFVAGVMLAPTISTSLLSN